MGDSSSPSRAGAGEAAQSSAAEALLDPIALEARLNDARARRAEALARRPVASLAARMGRARPGLATGEERAEPDLSAPRLRGNRDGSAEWAPEADPVADVAAEVSDERAAPAGGPGFAEAPAGFAAEPAAAFRQGVWEDREAEPKAPRVAARRRRGVALAPIALAFAAGLVVAFGVPAMLVRWMDGPEAWPTAVEVAAQPDPAAAEPASPAPPPAVVDVAVVESAPAVAPEAPPAPAVVSASPEAAPPPVEAARPEAPGSPAAGAPVGAPGVAAPAEPVAEAPAETEPASATAAAPAAVAPAASDAGLPAAASAQGPAAAPVPVPAPAAEAGATGVASSARPRARPTALAVAPAKAEAAAVPAKAEVPPPPDMPAFAAGAGARAAAPTPPPAAAAPIDVWLPEGPKPRGGQRNAGSAPGATGQARGAQPARPSIVESAGNDIASGMRRLDAGMERAVRRVERILGGALPSGSKQKSAQD